MLFVWNLRVRKLSKPHGTSYSVHFYEFKHGLAYCLAERTLGQGACHLLAPLQNYAIRFSTELGSLLYSNTQCQFSLSLKSYVRESLCYAAVLVQPAQSGRTYSSLHVKARSIDEQPRNKAMDAHKLNNNRGRPCALGVWWLYIPNSSQLPNPLHNPTGITFIYLTPKCCIPCRHNCRH
jgi:hypothetical protein